MLQHLAIGFLTVLFGVYTGLFLRAAGGHPMALALFVLPLTGYLGGVYLVWRGPTGG